MMCGTLPVLSLRCVVAGVAWYSAGLPVGDALLSDVAVLVVGVVSRIAAAYS